MKKQGVITHYQSYPEEDIHMYKRQIQEPCQKEAKAEQVLEVKRAVAQREREMVREM